MRKSVVSSSSVRGSWGACHRLRLAAVSLLALSPASLAGGGGGVVLSFSGGADLGGLSVDDEELVVVGDGPTRRFLVDQALALHLGDLDGDGLDDEPNDVDALELVATAPGAPMIAGVHLSLLQDQGGFKDGDVIRFDPGGPNSGLEVVYSEEHLIAALVESIRIKAHQDVHIICSRPSESPRR